MVLAKPHSISYIIYDRRNQTLYSLLIMLVTFIALLSLSNLDTIYASHLQINTTKLTANMYIIYGSGGNVILSIGNDGAILVDDQYAPVTEKLKSVIANLTDKQIKFVINTHSHPDHDCAICAVLAAGCTVPTFAALEARGELAAQSLRVVETVRPTAVERSAPQLPRAPPLLLTA